MTRDRVFLAHAAVCPLPTRVRTAITEYVDLASKEGQFGCLHHRIEEDTRERAAKLLGASPDEIAFVGSTSMGLSLIAAGLDWQAGDNVVVAEYDFPANIYPWLNLKRKGVEVRFVPYGLHVGLTADQVGGYVDDRTRLVSLSSVHYVGGVPIDLHAIGSFLRCRGILFCVDAIQSLGALPCSVSCVDFLAADAHKWLLGPEGIGILFVRRENFQRLHPALLGWRSVSDYASYETIDLKLPDAARRYEPGSLNILGIAGLHAALSLIEEIGTDAIAEQLSVLRSQLVVGLTKKGYTIVGNPDLRLRTGITSFKGEGIHKVYSRLMDKGIIVSSRHDHSGNQCLRVSPHFYNTQDEIDVLLNEL